MRKHWPYLKYLARHKWYVLLAGLRLGPPPGRLAGVRWLVRLLLHDWSKLLPDEWGPYADYFYGPPVEGCPPCKAAREAAFARAWLRHQHRAPHHFQHWVLRGDDGTVRALPMDPFALREMVADWLGAGRALRGKWGARGWYLENSHRICLHEASRAEVHRLLGVTRLPAGTLVAAKQEQPA